MIIGEVLKSHKYGTATATSTANTDHESSGWV